MNWENQIAILSLSASGREALRRFFSEPIVEVEVQFADEAGLWVLLDRQPSGDLELGLVRWDHFDTAQVNLVSAPPISPKLLGFAR